MQEIEFTKEDEYCIRNFGYNEVKDYEDLKQLEDENHLIVEELEYRLQQKENIIKEVRDKKEELMYLASKCSIIYRNNIEVVAIYDRLKELFEILDKGE